MINLYNKDCLEAMREMADNTFDLAIVDPPYGIGDTFISHTTGNKPQKLKRIHKSMYWDNKIPDLEYFYELKRVSKKQIIWGANYFNCFSKSGGALIWYKNKGAPTLSACEIASVSFQKKVDYIFIQSLGGFCAKEKNIHPTQKPVELYAWILSKYAKKGDKILDTHIGSGSIAIACHDLGFDLEGYEIDEEYYQGAISRLENHQKQLRLFQ